MAVAAVAAAVVAVPTPPVICVACPVEWVHPRPSAATADLLPTVPMPLPRLMAAAVMASLAAMATRLALPDPPLGGKPVVIS